MKKPWKDIAPYDTSDAANFKGRDEDIRKFTKILRQNEFSVLYAESGIGKTSFINAGIIPAFVGEDYDFIRVEFPLEVLSPIGDKTDEGLKANLERWLCNKIFPKKGRLLQEFAEATSIEQKLENNLWWKLHAYQYKVGERIKKTFIIFDQFEEVFQKANPGLLRKLFAILDSISSRIPPHVVLDELEKLEKEGIYVTLNRSADFKVLFSLRKEYLAEFDYWTNDVYSNPQLLQSRMILLPFTKAQAEEVITQQKIGEEQVTTLVDVKDDILNLFEQRMSDFTTNSRKHSYEAFLLSIVCSRLYAIAIDSQKKKLTTDDLVNINLKELILKFYNESIGDFIPKRHLKIIEEELVDNSGERNRIKLTTDNLVAIKFQERYLPELKNKHIVKSSDGYVELIHDRVAEAVFYKRKEYNRKQWLLLQRIVISCFILFFTGMAFWLGWSNASFETGYSSREITEKEFKIPTTNERCVNEPSVEFLVADNDLQSNGIIVNCPNLKDIEIHGRKPVSNTLYIEDCSRLVSLSISDSITELFGRIAECPNLHQIRLPRNVDYISRSFFENIDSLEIEVPETVKDKFIYENKILWDLKRERIVYAQVDADTLLLFPKELEHCDSLQYYGKSSRKFRNAKNERPKIDVKGDMIVKVNPFNNTVVDLSDTIKYGKIKRINKKAFYNCRNLKGIKLPRNLEYIDDEAFAGCSSLDFIDFPSSLRVIGSEAFSSCTNLTEIKLPESLDSLGRYTFSGCSRLKKVHLPDRVNLRKENDVIYTQFDGCDSLDNISFSEKSVFSAKNGIIFCKEEPCFFIGKNINYSDSTIKIKDDVLTYLYYEGFNIKGNNVRLSHSIYVMNKKRHVAFPYANGSRTRENPIVYNPDSVEYLPLFRRGVVFVGSHKLRELHVANVSPRNTTFYLPEVLKSKITLYVPYGCKKYFSGQEYSLFKEIKEDSWALRFQNMLYEMLDMTLSQSKAIYIFCIAIVLFVYFLVYIIYKKRYLKKHSKENTSKALWIAFFTLFVFLLTWMSIYWTLFFTFDSYFAMIIGHFIGLVGALFSTWILVYARDGDVWMTIKKGVWLFVAKCKSLTLEDMKRYLTVLLKRIYLMLARRIKNNAKVILAVLLIGTLTSFFLHRRSSWSEAIDKAELMMLKNLDREDIIKIESLLYTSMPHWKFFLSEQQKNKLMNIYDKIGKEIPNTEVISVFSEKGHTRSVNSVCFSNNDNLIITGSSDKTAIIWNAVTGDTIRTLWGHRGDVESVSFSHDDKLVVTGSSDYTAIIWDAVTCDTIRTLRGHKGRVNAVSFSYDDKLVVTGSSYDTAIIWDVMTGDTIRALHGSKNSYFQSIESVAFSHDNRLIVTGSSDGTAIIWDTLTGDSIHALHGSKRYRSINSVAFSHDDRLIVTGSSDGTAIIWDTLTGDSIRSMKGYDRINIVFFSHDGDKIFVGTERNVSIIDYKSLDSRQVNTRNRIFNDNCEIATMSENHDVCIYNDNIAAIWKRDTCIVNESVKKPVVVNHDGSRVASGHYRNTAKIWNVLTGNVIHLRGHKDDVESLAFSHNGNYIISGSQDKTAIIWDAIKGDSIHTLRGHESTISSVSFSHDEKYVVTGSSDSTAIVWDVSSGDSVCSWRTNDKVKFVSFSQDNSNVIIGKWMEVVKLNPWNTGEPINKIKYELDAPIARFSPDSRFVIDRDNKVYDVETGKFLYKIYCKNEDDIYFSTNKDEFYVVSDKSVQKVKLMSWDKWIESCHETLSKRFVNN